MGCEALKTMRVACIVGRERLQSLQGASVRLLKGIKM